MFDFKKYRIKFDIWGLVLFAIIMMPNLIWFAVPTENDILRKESITPIIDFAASVFQVIMVASMCLIKNDSYSKPKNKMWTFGMLVTVGLYFFGWCMYYGEIVNAVVIMLLCVAPCLAFLIFSVVKKNGVSFVAASLFMVCHVIYGCANFIF